MEFVHRVLFCFESQITVHKFDPDGVYRHHPKKYIPTLGVEIVTERVGSSRTQLSRTIRISKKGAEIPTSPG